MAKILLYSCCYRFVRGQKKGTRGLQAAHRPTYYARDTSHVIFYTTATRDDDHFRVKVARYSRLTMRPEGFRSIKRIRVLYRA
uniref:Uncharacterized protein n=1 Tax=Trichogramma kaykai TaxID=54128 RepID=A0ABD2WR72_9HYME